MFKGPYSKLFFSGMINGLGDRFSQVAMLTLLLKLTGSGFSVGMVMMLRLLPFLFFAPIGGRLADRFPRKNILVITDLGRIIFAFSFLLVHSENEVWIIYISAFVLAAGEAIYAPVRKSVLPLMVKRNDFARVNSLEQVLTGIVLIIGAFSGGIISFIWGQSIAFCMNGLSFLIAALINSTITLKETKIRPNSECRNHSFLLSVRTMIRYSFSIQIIISCILLVSLVNGIDNVLISIYAVKVFHLGDLGVGVFYGALGVGLVLSFSIASRLKKHFIVIGFICLFFEGMMLIFLSISIIATMAILAFSSAALFSGIGNTCFETVMMKEIPDEFRGTTFGLTEALSNFLLGLSMFFSGTVLAFISPRHLGFIGGLGFIIISIVLCFVLIVRSAHSAHLKGRIL